MFVICFMASIINVKYNAYKINKFSEIPINFTTYPKLTLTRSVNRRGTINIKGSIENRAFIFVKRK